MDRSKQCVEKWFIFRHASNAYSDSSLHEKVDYTVANEKNIKETGPREIETKVGTSYT